MKKVIIGIQCRSNSTRLPDKALKEFEDGQYIIDHIVKEAVKAAGWLVNDRVCQAIPVLLVPKDDKLASLMGHKIQVFEGAELDVLARYQACAEMLDPDYMVRITGDCCWMTAKMIAKVVRDGLRNRADYTSNITVRTFMEGLDCEMFSRDCLDYMDAHTPEPVREHVTMSFVSDLKSGLNPGFVIHTVLNDYDLSDLKTSIDTEQEYDQAQDMLSNLRTKRKQATRMGTISI